MAKEATTQSTPTNSAAFDLRKLVGTQKMNVASAVAVSTRINGTMYEIVHGIPLERLLSIVLSGAEKKELRGKSSGFKTVSGVPCNVLLHVPADPDEAERQGFPREIAGQGFQVTIVQNVGPTSLTRIQAAAYPIDSPAAEVKA